MLRYDGDVCQSVKFDPKLFLIMKRRRRQLSLLKEMKDLRDHLTSLRTQASAVNKILAVRAQSHVPTHRR